MTYKKPDPTLFVGDLYGEFYQSEQSGRANAVPWRDLVKGIATSVIVALAALWLAQQYGFPAILAGLLLGLALQFLAELPSLAPGLDFVSKQVLRAGSVLLGLQVSLFQSAGLFRALGHYVRVIRGLIAGRQIDRADALCWHFGGRCDGDLRRLGGLGALCGDWARSFGPSALYSDIGGHNLGQRHRACELSCDRSGAQPV